MDNTDLANATPEMALILAAGLGSRLRPQTKTPKPLTRVLGLTLAERVVCILLAVGVQRFLVTLGHEAETVRAHFLDIARRRGVIIDFIEAEDWEQGNGASALAAKGRTGEAPFFLVMIDHHFDPKIARALADDPPAPREMCLAVDRDKDAIFDLDDVTRVKIDDGLPEGWPESVPVSSAPFGRLMKPEEIAAAAVYWLSDESRLISGSVVDLEQYPLIGRVGSKQGD